jgi:hypothetical protein
MQLQNKMNLIQYNAYTLFLAKYTKREAQKDEDMMI